MNRIVAMTQFLLPPLPLEPPPPKPTRLIIGYPTVRPSIEREGEGGRQRGFFVVFGYTKDAEQERAAYYKRTGRIIKLLTVQEILDEEHVQKM